MTSITRKGVRLALAAALAMTGLVGVTSLTAAGSGDRPIIDYGTLTLTLTDRAGTLTLDRAPGFGGGTFTQGLGVAEPCSTLVAGPVAPAGTGNLLRFSAAVQGGSSPNVQLPSNGIGVTDGANCGVPSGLVGPGETLTLDLEGGFLPTDVVVETATLRIGKTQATDRNLLVAYDGGTFVNPLPGNGNLGIGVTPVTVDDPADGKFRSISIRSTANQSSRGVSLRSDTVFILKAPAPATVPDAPTDVRAEGGDAQATVSWTAPSDGGADISSYQLEYRPTGDATWIPAPNDPNTATATTRTVIGLENGKQYIFRVAAVNEVGTGDFEESNAVTPLPGITALLDCGEDLPILGEPGDIATSAVFLRGENSDPKVVGDAETCARVNATVAIVNGPDVPGEITDFVYWDNETVDAGGFGQRVNATITIEWAAIPPAKANLPTQIDYDGYEPAGGFVDAQWCTSFTEVLGPNGEIIYTGELPEYTGPGANPDDTAPWCLVSSNEVLRGGEVFRTDVFFGSGDPRGATIR